ncbi:hypothetical protein F383_09452 [Gossypium arboreum]|uniref:Uncharacterized protein n=1 Tax=Gossypium arboreum TaxID=29729 RepID=A0A0B0NBT5_GOSAR|nr:hypothetical protein F383_09452 [Gossypium arboreum]
MTYTGRLHARACSTVLTMGWSNHTQECHTEVSLPSPSITLFRKGQYWGLLGILKPI